MGGEFLYFCQTPTVFTFVPCTSVLIFVSCRRAWRGGVPTRSTQQRSGKRPRPPAHEYQVSEKVKDQGKCL